MCTYHLGIWLKADSGWKHQGTNLTFIVSNKLLHNAEALKHSSDFLLGRPWEPSGPM